MSSFYGDIKNSNRISLIFDKIYPSRKAMDDACPTDGIFNNRFVLIDYGQMTTFPFTRVYPTEEEYNLGVQEGKYYKVVFVPPNTDIWGALGYNAKESKPYTRSETYDKDKAYFIKRDSLLDSKALGVNFSADLADRPVQCPYVRNKEKDLVTYGDEYQHTVWQKIWTQTGDTNTVVEKYICVARLDAETPMLNLVVDAPSDYDAEGFEYVATDKNIDGYLSKARYADLQNNADSWVYTKKEEGGRTIYVPSTEYHIDYIYYTFAETAFQETGRYRKIYDETGVNILHVEPYTAPQLYKKWSFPKEKVQEKHDAGSTIYISMATDSGMGYMVLQDITTLNRDEYYTFERTTYKNGARYCKSSTNADVMVDFFPPILYTASKAISGHDFEDGYITEQKYLGYNKELFYFDTNGNIISTLNSITTPASGTNPNGIYYKDRLGNIVKKTSVDYPSEYSYFKKKAYVPTTRYWEVTSLGHGPHFDPLKSTDLEYMFHVPRPWKFARDVEFDYNPRGFVPYKKTFGVSGINSIKLETETENLTTKYPVHMPDLPDAIEYETEDSNNEIMARSYMKMEPQPDTKYFDIRLPEIGNAISDMWDIVYPRGKMISVAANTVPEKEYDSNDVNLLLNEEGLANYYCRTLYNKPGIISKEKYDRLKGKGLLAIYEDGNYIEPLTYDYNQIYYEIKSTESGTQYIKTPSDVEVYRPVYEIADIRNLKAEGKTFYKFQKSEDGAVRVMFIGNDRNPDNNADYPGTIGEVVRHSYYLLGRNDDEVKDNDTVDNPPRGTIYGLLNGAKTLYGDPADKVTGTFKEVESLTSAEFDELKDLLWYYDTANNTWAPAKDTIYDSGLTYFTVETPGYQLVPTDIKIEDGHISEAQFNKIKDQLWYYDDVNKTWISVENNPYDSTKIYATKNVSSNEYYLVHPEDGYISEELFNKLISKGKKLYVPDGINTFTETTEYDSNAQYYSDLTTLWAYLNDIKEKYPLYQADWQNNNGNSIGYIKNRPTMVASSENDEYTEDGTFEKIEELWEGSRAINPDAVS